MGGRVELLDVNWGPQLRSLLLEAECAQLISWYCSFGGDGDGGWEVGCKGWTRGPHCLQQRTYVNILERGRGRGQRGGKSGVAGGRLGGTTEVNTARIRVHAVVCPLSC